MDLSKLLAAYGDDKVQFQMLDECVTNFSRTKQGTKATFVTPQSFDLNGFGELGLIVWLDREQVKAIIAKSKSSPALADELDSSLVDLNFLRKAIVAGDPTPELLIRVDDLIRHTNSALPLAKDVGRG